MGLYYAIVIAATFIVSLTIITVPGVRLSIEKEKTKQYAIKNLGVKALIDENTLKQVKDLGKIVK